MPSPLILIPARGGSVGIPRKACRYLGGKPLLWYAIDACQGFGRVVVLTDDDEIALLAQRRGVEVQRDLVPTDNTRTLDRAVWHALRALDPTGQAPVVATVQPTSPFLTAKTIRDCLVMAATGRSAITVCRDGHIRFGGPAEDPALLSTWATRQQLAGWKLTGGCIAAPRDHLNPDRRWGEPFELVPVDGAEALDLDTPSDWAVAEFYANRLTIAYRVDGGGELGLGHVYRAHTLLGRLVGQSGAVYMDEQNYPEGVALANRLGLLVMPADEFASVRTAVTIIENRPMSTPWLRHARDVGQVVVAIEDRTEMACDLLFNDLDGPERHGPQIFQGPRYAVVREEFLSVTPLPLAPTVQNIVLTFGGTDPADLTRKSLAALERIKRRLSLTVIIGPGYPPSRELPLRSRHEIQVIRGPRLLSPYLGMADLAITSCGRTVYELVACQTPTVALPQNAHELRHASLSYDCGVWAVPQAGHQLDTAILAPLFHQAMDTTWRQHARTRMASLDVRHGADRFWDLVRAARVERQRSPVMA